MKNDEAIEVLLDVRDLWQRPATWTPATNAMRNLKARRLQALDIAIAALSDAPHVAPARRTDPTTSQESADLVRPKQAHRALLAVLRDGEAGVAWTAKRLAEHAQIDAQASWWKRVSEIKHAGYIVAVGTERSPDTGRKVETYRLTEKGRTA